MKSVSVSIKLALLLLIIATFFVYLPHLLLLPVGRHVWAQSDFLALAEGFVRNGLDFFHPQTYQLNLQFPSTVPPVVFEGITSVDFPIHPYLIAVISTLFKAIPIQVIFRLYTFLWAVFATIKVFQLGIRLGVGQIKAFFLAALLLLNPGLFLYQFGFQPTSIALDCTVVAILYAALSFKSNCRRDYLFALLFFTLSTLVRTTHILFFAGFGLTLLWRIFFKKERLLVELSVAFLAGLFIIGYFLYNGVLAAKYGTIFLGAFMLPQSWHHVLLAVVIGLGQRLYYYLPIPLLLVVIWYLKDNWHHRTPLVVNSHHRLFKYFMVFSAVGVLLFFAAMMYQFIHHDYYLLDTFTPVGFMLVLFLFMFDKIEVSAKQLVIFVGLMFLFSSVQYFRTVERTKNERGYQTHLHFQQSEEFLTSLGISYDSKLLVIDAYAPNVPFLQMKRAGFIVMTTSKENIERALTWPFEYCITQNAFFDSDIRSNFPEITNHLSLVATNGDITVWQLSDNAKKHYRAKFNATSVYW